MIDRKFGKTLMIKDFKIHDEFQMTMARGSKATIFLEIAMNRFFLKYTYRKIFVWLSVAFDEWFSLFNNYEKMLFAFFIDDSHAAFEHFP